MITIGLTGGIGSGKSTVSLMLKTAGFEIIDADIIARDVLKKYPEILEKVKIEFGAGFFDWILCQPFIYCIVSVGSSLRTWRWKC